MPCRFRLSSDCLVRRRRVREGQVAGLMRNCRGTGRARSSESRKLQSSTFVGSPGPSTSDGPVRRVREGQVAGLMRNCRETGRARSSESRKLQISTSRQVLRNRPAPLISHEKPREPRRRWQTASDFSRRQVLRNRTGLPACLHSEPKRGATFPGVRRRAWQG